MSNEPEGFDPVGSLQDDMRESHEAIEALRDSSDSIDVLTDSTEDLEAVGTGTLEGGEGTGTLEGGEGVEPAAAESSFGNRSSMELTGVESTAALTPPPAEAGWPLVNDSSSGSGSGSGSDSRTGSSDSRRGSDSSRVKSDTGVGSRPSGRLNISSVRPEVEKDSDDPNVGRILDGKYELIGQLGKGGMATVYTAWHLLLKKKVAVKFIRPGSEDNVRFRARFFREARIASELVHKNVVPVREFGETEDGYFFMVMDFIEGSTLTLLLRAHGPCDQQRAISVGRQILAALGEAHSLGIVHRDIKPDNIILDHKGVVHVLDFGLAKVLELEEGQDDLTSAGVVLGTPMYMSPEQASGSTCDTRSDIYSVGVILYELLTGKVPYRARSSQDMIRAHIIAKPIAMTERLPGTEFNDRLEEVILKALAKHAVQRWQTAEEFRTALGSIEQDVEVDLEMDAVVVPGTFTNLRPVALPIPQDEIELYRARHSEFDEEGLLWLVNMEDLRRDRVSRFKNQIDLCQRVEHPSLANGQEAGIYDRGARQAYVYEEWTGQCSLKDRMASGPMELGAWFEIFVPLLEGVAKAHEFSLAHLHISPSLVALSEQGPVLHGLGVSCATRTGWGNPENDVEDLARLGMELLAGASGTEVGVEMLKQEVRSRCPKEISDLLEKGLRGGFESAGGFARAAQVVRRRVEGGSDAGLEAPAPQPEPAPVAPAPTPAAGVPAVQVPPTGVHQVQPAPAADQGISVKTLLMIAIAVGGLIAVLLIVVVILLLVR